MFATRFLCFLALCLLIAFPAVAATRAEGIAAIVNQDAVTMSDLNERIRLIAISSGLRDTPEIREHLSTQVMESLIDEQLMLQEAARLGIEVTDAEIDQGFATLAEQNKITPDQFVQMIKRTGINISTMRRQIRAQIGWSKVIQKVMRPQITVSDADIDEHIDRLAVNKGKTEYLVAEIFLPVESPAQEADTRLLAAKLVSEMKNGKAPFTKVAQQFSKAPGAAQGGSLGWIQEGLLQAELDSALKTMEPNALSAPLRSMDGYHILFLRDRRTISDETMPTREQALNSLGVQRLERAQRRYLLDLKTAAFIENRVQS